MRVRLARETDRWPLRHPAGIAVVVAALLLLGGTARAERWLCPECPDTEVERVPGSPTLDCGNCGGTYAADELSWLITYLDYRTRPAEASFVLLPEDCSIYRADGLQVFDAQRREVWVPWILVDWYIPRQRVLRLRDGRELTTDYAKGTTCPAPPNLVFAIADTVRIAGQPERIRSREIEANLAELFVVARTPEARASAIARFIEEVEAGKHPRLPRTSARLTRPTVPAVPASLRGKGIQADAVVHVRASEQGQVLEVRVLESSGKEALDQAAVQAALSSGYFTAGEMGVPVPATLHLRYAFRGDDCTVEAIVPPNSIWEN